MAQVDEIMYATAKYIFRKVGKYVDIDQALAARITQKAMRKVRAEANFCKGVTTAGISCSRKAKAPTEYCFQHQGPRMVYDDGQHRHRSWEEKAMEYDEAEELDELIPEKVRKEKKKTEKKHKKSKKSKKEKKEKRRKHRHPAVEEDVAEESTVEQEEVATKVLVQLPRILDRVTYLTLSNIAHGLLGDMQNLSDAETTEAYEIVGTIGRVLEKVPTTLAMPSACHSWICILNNRISKIQNSTVSVETCYDAANMYLRDHNLLSYEEDSN
jgi:hypothetical protein